MARNVVNIVQELLQGVEDSARQFRLYERLHRGKGTPDGDAKADVNAGLAHELEQIANRARGIEYDQRN